MGDHLTFSAHQVLGVPLILLPLLISLLVGLSVLLIIAGLRAYSARHGSRLESIMTPTPAWERQVLPYLKLIPVPGNLIQRWGGSSVLASLVHAGLDWDGRAYAAMRWAGLWVALILAFVLGLSTNWNLVSQFLVLVILLLSIYGPHLWLQWRGERRSEAIDLALPAFLDRLALSMEAGLGFEIAFRRTSSTLSGLLGEELGKFVRELDRGHTRLEALDRLVSRNPSSDLAAFVAAVKQSDRLGTSLARTLRIQTKILRARRRRRAEEASRRLPILIVFPLVFFFLPALLIIYLAPPILHLFLGR